MRKPSFFTISGLPCWHQKAINKSCFFNSLLGPHFSHFLSIRFQEWSIWGPLQNPVGAQTGPTIDHFWNIGEKRIDAQRFRDRLEKHKYMQKRQVDRSFVFYLFLLLLFSKFSGTTFKTKYVFPSSLGVSVKYIEKHRADELSEIQWPPKEKQPKTQKGSIRLAFLDVFVFSDFSGIIVN